MLLKVALNGARSPGEHPALPLTPEQLACAAQEAVAAGAAAIHAHVRGADGRESLHAGDVARAVAAIRARCPNISVGVSTGAWIVPNPEQRLELVRGWTTLPDFASVNLDEDGSVDLAKLLIARGIGVEVGIPDAPTAEILARSGIAGACLRVMIEPGEGDVAAARANVEQIEIVLDRAGIDRPRLLHGAGPPAWDLLRNAAARGYDTRIGLEDTLALPDGAPAADNAALVAAARQLIEALSDSPGSSVRRQPCI